jgi:hypothetical protein
MTERGTLPGSFPKYQVTDKGTFNNRRPLNPSVGASYKAPRYEPSVLKSSGIQFETSPDDEYTMPPTLNITTSYYDGISGFETVTTEPVNKKPCCEDGIPAPKKVALSAKLDNGSIAYVNYDGKVKYDKTMMDGNLKKASKDAYYY